MVEPAAVGTKKKGLSPLAWVAIGCGILILAAGAVMLAGGIFVAGKVKEAVDQAEDNPVAFAAETIVRLNPDLEMVESDRDAGTIEVRQKSTGKTMVFDYEDIEQGRFSFEGSDGESLQVDAAAAARGEAPAVTYSDGETTSTIGTGAELPSWLPAYPGAEQSTGISSVTGERKSGTYIFQTADSLDAVTGFYREAMEELGIEPETATSTAGGTTLVSLRGRSEEVEISVTATEAAGEVSVQLEFSGPG